jgi:hypothetical protein
MADNENIELANTPDAENNAGKGMNPTTNEHEDTKALALTNDELNDLFISFLYGILDLGENIFTIFYFSTRFSFGFVFLTFLVVDIIASVPDIYKSIKPSMVPDLMSIIVEYGQCMIYIYFCDYVYEALIFFPVIATVQATAPMLSIIRNDYDVGDDSLSFGDVFARRVSALGMGFGVLLYTFTSSGSVFQFYWFQVALTSYIWLLTFINDNMKSYAMSTFYAKMLPDVVGESKVKSVKPGDFLGFFAMYIIALITFAASIYYYQRGIDNTYDFVVTIMGIIAGAMMLLVTVCGLCLLYTLHATGMTLSEVFDTKDEQEVDPETIAKIQAYLRAMDEHNQDYEGQANSGEGSKDVEENV